MHIHVSVFAEQFNVRTIADSITLESKAALDVFCAVKDGKMGWMNVLGDWVIPPSYDSLHNQRWSEGMLVCRKDGKYGVLNAKNEIIVPFEFKKAPAHYRQGLIKVENNEKKWALFSKRGEQLCDFKNNSFPEFNNGFAVSISNRKILGGYPRVDLEDSQGRTTEIYTCDFALINTNFDTLLFVENSPFLIELGVLNEDRRSFVLYPYMAMHADRGISYGMFGFLNANGKISIPPQYEAFPYITQTMQGNARDPYIEFHSNRALIYGKDNERFYVNKQGEKVFDVHIPKRKILYASYFNDHGLAGIRTSAENPNSIMLHLIDTTGKIIFQALESDATMSLISNISITPRNTFIPISDKKNKELRIYTPNFKFINSFPSKDSLYRYKYALFVSDNNDKNPLFLETRNELVYKTLGNQKRVINASGSPLTEWVDTKAILSIEYNNYSYFDSLTQQNALADFSGKVLYSEQNCYFNNIKQLEKYGLHKVRKEGRILYVNFKGQVISNNFSTMTEKIYSLSEQIDASYIDETTRLNIDKTALFEIFNQSVMSQRIINSKNRE
jgi:hypothetical protein